MARLISSHAEAHSNILNYSDFIKESVVLRNNLAMNRAWYAVRTNRGWAFGSSKVIGYANMKPTGYQPKELDGRQTETVLQKWFTEVDEDNPLYDELWRELMAFLAAYGKSPSKLARINVLKSEVDEPAEHQQDMLCNLILEVAKGLDVERIKRLRQRLKSLVG